MLFAIALMPAFGSSSPPSGRAPRHAAFRGVPPCDGDLDDLSGFLTIARENRLLREAMSIPASPTNCTRESGFDGVACGRGISGYASAIRPGDRGTDGNCRSRVRMPSYLFAADSCR